MNKPIGEVSRSMMAQKSPGRVAVQSMAAAAMPCVLTLACVGEAYEYETLSEASPMGPNTSGFEEFEHASRSVVLGVRTYTAERDIYLGTNVEDLLHFYEGMIAGPQEKSVVNVVGSVRDLRPDPMDIQYCFVDGWGTTTYSVTGDWDGDEGTPDTTQNANAPALSNVRPMIEAGTRAWAGAANVRFVYRSDLDGASCVVGAENPSLAFAVQHYDAFCTAQGPFPSGADQRLLVPVCNLPEMAGRQLYIHEIGHAIGLRHEHIHTDASPRCGEGGSAEELTDFDAASAMIYDDCTESSVIAGNELSRLDGVGARELYGEPGWWWAGVFSFSL